VVDKNNKNSFSCKTRLSNMMKYFIQQRPSNRLSTDSGSIDN